MNNVSRLFAVTLAVIGSACGGGTTPPSDGMDATADGIADERATVDVASEPTPDVTVGDVPAKWQRLGLDNGFGPCPPQVSCSSSWSVSPDGHIAKVITGDAGSVQMTSADLNELDTIITSAPFLAGMANGFVCDRPPTDVFISLRLEKDGGSQTQGVTGCVFSGPAGNLPRRVNEILTKY